MIPRGLVRSPSTFVAFHPLAKTDANTGDETPAHEAGMTPILVLIGPVLVVDVDVVMVVDGLLVVEVLVLIGAGAKRLLATQVLKFGLRAAFKSWFHLPIFW